MKHGSLALIAVLLIFSSAPWFAAAAEADHASVTALFAVLSKNIAHAREWLDQSDARSLAQSAGGLKLLAELLAAKSDDHAWQTACASIVSAASAVHSAARDEDLNRCKATLNELAQAVAAAGALQPTGKPLAPPRPPALRPLMLTMDAVQADAKIALLTGDVSAAKKQSHVLAELARLVSNSRNTERWSALAGEFADAANAAAVSTETDASAVRQLLRNVSRRCEACHDNSRTR